MDEQRPYRATGQFLMPPEISYSKRGEYDIYPGQNIGPGKIHYSAVGFADRVGPVPILLIDGVEGVFWERIEDQLTKAYAQYGKSLLFVETSSFFKEEKELREIIAPFLNDDDPVFGRITDLRLEDWFRRIPVVTPRDGFTTVVIGPGASFFHPDAPLAFVELPKNEFQFRLRADTTSCLGFSAHWDKKQMYKQAFFVDWEVLGTHKREILDRVDWLIDSQQLDELMFMSGEDFREALLQMAHSMFRVRPWFEPGVWGGVYMRDHFGGLNRDVENLAWSFELMARENGLILESDGFRLEFAFEFLMYGHARDILGKSFDRFGYDFPIRFDFLDTIRGGNLSIQCHPTTEYIRREFGMPFTQDETYYILESEQDSSVYLGFQDDIDKDAFLSALEWSQRESREIDIEKYVQRHPSKKHDLFLIPNGTIHGSGAGNLVLEISTAPYIFTFKMYDWMRLDLDGKPRPINIQRGMDNLNFSRKGEYVREHLFCHPRTLWERDGVKAEYLPTHPDHFYHVFRYSVEVSSGFDTEGQADVWMLTEGTSVLVETSAGIRRRYNYAETFVIPSACGKYSITNETPGRKAVLVRARVKD